LAAVHARRTARISGTSQEAILDGDMATVDVPRSMCWRRELYI
jgi:hypothetical protein